MSRGEPWSSKKVFEKLVRFSLNPIRCLPIVFRIALIGGGIFHQVAMSDGPGELAFLVRNRDSSDPLSEQGSSVLSDGKDVSAYGQSRFLYPQ